MPLDNINDCIWTQVKTTLPSSSYQLCMVSTLTFIELLKVSYKHCLNVKVIRFSETGVFVLKNPEIVDSRTCVNRCEQPEDKDVFLSLSFETQEQFECFFNCNLNNGMDD